MKKVTFILLVSVLLFSFQKVQAQDDPTRVVKVNLTVPSAPSSLTDWNDIVDSSAGSITDLKDDKGNATPFKFYNEVAPSEANSTQGTPGCTIYPDAVAIPLWNMKAGVTLYFEFRGLNDDALYDFDVFGSRNATNNRPSLYTIGEETVQLYASRTGSGGNVSEVAEFFEVAPVSGVIRISAKNDDKNSDTNYGYINAIVMKEFDPTAATSNPGENAIKIYSNNNEICVSGAQDGDLIHVYGIDGKKLSTQELVKGTVKSSNLSTGLYLIKVTDCSGNRLKKVSKLFK